MIENIFLTLFWAGIFITFYVYLFYGVIVKALLFIKKNVLNKKISRPYYDESELPEVTVIIAAYNEQDFIADKIENTFQTNYPKHKLNVWVVADGSTDNTSSIASAFGGVKVFFKPERRGKIHAVNRVMKMVQTPITIFTDANTFLNKEALHNLVHPFKDSKTGVVAGEKKVLSTESDSAAGAGEGFYWKYESWLKAADAQLGSTMGAAGELFAIKTALYKEISSDTLIEDFVLSIQIAAEGYKIAYAPKAIASELPSANVKEEEKRKIRIAAGGLQAVWRLRKIMDPFKYPLLSFQFVSHRALRWTLAPLSLPFILLSNIGLAVESNYVIYKYALLLQVGFYTLAFAFYLLKDKNLKSKILFIPFYFTMMNLSVFKGLFRLINNQQSVVWEKAKRREISTTINQKADAA